MAEGGDDAVLTLLRGILAGQGHLRGEIKVIGGEVEDFRIGLVTLRSENSDVRADIKTLRGEPEDLCAVFSTVRSEISDMRGELNVVHYDSHDMCVGIHDMRGKIAEFQSGMAEIRRVVIGHSLRFDALDEKFELVREGTISAIGFAVSANESNKRLKEQFAEFAKRVDKLEQAK